MRGVWKRSHGRATKAPPDERGGNRHARPNVTAPHSYSTVSGSSAQIEVIPSIGWRTGQSATQKRPSVRAKRVANPPFLDFDSETRRRASWRVWQKTSANRLLDASSPEKSFA